MCTTLRLVGMTHALRRRHGTDTRMLDKGWPRERARYTAGAAGWRAVAVGIALVASPRIARANDPVPVAGAVAIPAHGVVVGRDESDPVVDYVTPRYEPAGFPLIGGNSDTGLMFGAAGTLTRFASDVQPYRWNMDMVLSASIKDGPSGVEFTEYHLLWDWDIPGLAGGHLRLNPMMSLQQDINIGYYGLGNASSAVRPANAVGVAGRYFESMLSAAQARILGRIPLVGHLNAAFVTGFRYMAPSAYDGSLLAVDAGTINPNGEAFIRGVQPLSLGEVTLGLIYDSRDSEIVPTRGMFNQASVRLVQAFPVDANVQYAEFGLSIAGYIPLSHSVVLAGRFVGDVQVGNVPFYDMYVGGPFNPDSMPGGASGIRGVPFGRYLGPVKFVANLELRSWVGSLTVLRQHFRIGTDVFFDTGRVWSDLTFNNPLDGTGVGLKFGVGAGMFVLWGQAAIFRVEAAYSPDAAAENANFPIGLYVEDGVMF